MVVSKRKLRKKEMEEDGGRDGGERRSCS